MEIHDGAVGEGGLLYVNCVGPSGPSFRVLDPRILRAHSHILTVQKTVQRDGS